MTGTDAPPAPTHLTIAETADSLGVKPWEVVRLIESGRLDAVMYVPAAAVRTYQETTK